MVRLNILPEFRISDEEYLAYYLLIALQTKASLQPVDMEALSVVIEEWDNLFSDEAELF